MGCCTSTAHTHRPSKPLTYPPFKYADNSQTEEIKDPDRYRKPSIDPTMMRIDSLPPSGLKKPVVQENSAQKSKQESVLKCEDISLVLSNKKENEQPPSASKVVVEEMNKSEPVTAKLRESSSTYKITREQHGLILKFAEEKRDVIEGDISRLYTHLLINHKEAEELPMLIETLKNNNRDVENCVDDLKMYPIVNDRAFYRVIERHDSLIKNVLSEYRTSLAKKSLNNYKTFRDAALDHIRQYNSSQQDTGVSENTSEPHTNEENGNLSEVYNRIVEDLGKVKEMKQSFANAKEILRTKYNDLGERVTDFQKKLHQQNGLSISEKIDYNSKLKVLNEQIQQGKQEIEDLDGGAQTQPQYMALSDILSTTSMFQSANTKPRGSLNGLKKYDNPNLFMERKLSVHSRPEIKQGDNGDNDLDMIDIEFK